MKKKKEPTMKDFFDGEVVKYNPSTSLKEIQKALENLWVNKIPEDKRKLTLYQQCITNCWVDKNATSSNLCNNPECGSYMEFIKMIREKFGGSI